MRDFFHRLLHTPRKTFLRRASFQIHLWCGVALGLYTAVIGLSGSMLVFREEIERALRPQIYTLQALAAPVAAPTLDEMLRGVERALPEYQPMGFEDLPVRPKAIAEKPIVLFVTPRDGRERFASHSRTQDQLLVFLDPRSGKILGVRSRYAGVLGFATNLHYYLLLGRSGYVINGVFAVCFLLLCLTGWVLWWPGIRRAFAALRVHGLRTRPGQTRNWRRLNWDFHTVGGFWSNPALVAVVATGIFFVFPQPVLYVVAFATHTSPQVIRAWYSSPESKTPPLGAQPITVQRAWEQVAAAIPEKTRIFYLSLPKNRTDAYGATVYSEESAPYAQPIRIYIDQYTAAAIAKLDSRSFPITLQAITYVYAVHFGSFAGLVSRILWFLLGLMPGALFLSGLIMWWKRVLGARVIAGKKQNSLARVDTMHS